jgi:predicted alpha-1,2-mannosidase
MILPAMLPAAVAPELADRVNVLIGTTGPHKSNYGGVCPWVSPPFAMTQWTPMTQENGISALPYRHEQRTLAGFMGTHQPTVWMSDYGFITIMPQTGAPSVLFAERGAPMKDGTEDARPYYYSIQTGSTEADTIRTEIAATSRCALFRFGYPDTDAAHLFVEISRVPGHEGWLRVSDDGREITGYNPGRHNHHRGRPMGPALEKFKGYYVIQFETPFTSAQTWKSTGNPDKQQACFFAGREVTGERAGAVVTFPASNGTPVKVRIGSSFISIGQARENLRREMPDWDFDGVVRKTKQEWNDALGRVIAEGGTDDGQVLFYTSMYHTLMFPRRFDEYGKYYSPFDEKIHEGVSYNDYSLWDTFRALHPLLTLTAPEHVSPMMQSLVQMYEEGGWMPKWPNPTYTNIMIGTPADSVVADAYVKGFRDFDVKKSYEAIYKNAMTPPDGDTDKRWADRAAWTSYEARAGLTYYKELGFVPVDKTNESVSNTLEYAYEDYCVAQMAKGLGREKDHEFFMRRSKNYRNLYNPKTGFMQARLADGTFFEGDPKEYRAFTEGSPWTYLFCAMHDIPGLLELMGRDEFISKLDENFSGGHFAYDNEPANHYPYLYAWVGQPEKTQRIVTDVMTKYFRTTPDGMEGNDDCGQMSALYVFTALGFYPVTPASGEYVIGRPFFKKSTLNITFPKKATFTVLAHNLTPENIYVKSVKLNGKPLESLFLKHADIVRGGMLEFEMTGTPPQPVD